MEKAGSAIGNKELCHFLATRRLDALAGYPVMTGVVYTEMAEFTV